MAVRGRLQDENTVPRDTGNSDTPSSGAGKELESATSISFDKRVSSMKQDITQALAKISSKENEKFNLIFSILSELQQRQAQLEDSVRALKAQRQSGTNNQAAPMPHVVGNQTDAAGAGTEAMQTYTVMQDGTQAVMAPVVFVQQMPQPMLMQFVGQAPVEEQQWSAAPDGQPQTEAMPAPIAVMAEAN
mmetsp:Transcript_12202/g.22518  ORF Transcript_12202/g.22518 Transcript_12202/m.22518 type:complete len:189 (-) Transcript_12202:206-772(-)